MKNKTLIFLHISKTAGTTLKQIIYRHIQGENIYRIPSGDSEIKKLIEKLDDSKQKIQLIHGHIPFGIHEYLPNQSEYITIIRNPIARIISRYYFTVNHKNHPQSKLFNDLGFENFIQEDNIITSNFQTRLLLGQSIDLTNYKNFSSLTKNAIGEVKQNLENFFSVVGTPEKFNEVVLLLGEKYRWQKLWYTNKRITRGKINIKNIPPYIIRILEEKNTLDMELFEYATKRIEREINNRGAKFQIELTNFKKENKYKGLIYSILESIYKKIGAFLNPKAKPFFKKLFSSIKPAWKYEREII
ncbi:MAG: hypothetical protein COU07_03075 [Candidatus Harrisonbacteria bacterium CG10_big_fil_rev_8_21_14_0_10_40_38]|uniref:Sulfotransferase domain-containing protein n=1 Tax=Candidatus Harrisonbacteria bacterium CG10_big_fil_rev_8_21_14_0_10_40_38 TaxID=1974583 RepID=A0A2H0URK1_9BACT|nr:MAG: hypothetical protein COU07_03075 [Candidatus Harrisonbacteria bacterium CG10_big_fil_rev_8_21_14_0_10_40_38]